MLICWTVFRKTPGGIEGRLFYWTVWGSIGGVSEFKEECDNADNCDRIFGSFHGMGTVLFFWRSFLVGQICLF